MSLNRTHLWILLAGTMLLRLLTLVAYPLMDTTEARYGEMARLMVETGNWLTPLFDYNIPFWGKPPMFTWMSATGIELFGLNEFAVRAPHWLAGLLVLILIAMFARRVGINALLAAVVLTTTVVFIVSSGTVMTDMGLTLGMTLAMVGFYRCWLGEKLWGYLGFVGLAIGLLAKGPLVLVLFGLAIGPWLMLQHGFLGCFRELWLRFPVLSGTALMLIIAVPWYVMAELATPGFLDYFLVGEHFKRFTVSGWEGDLYGTAHTEAKGTIWLFWVYACFPWSLVLPVVLWLQRKTIRSELRVDVSSNHGLLSFLLLWMLSPLVLFTLAGNILPAYVLPGVPALGLIMAHLLRDYGDKLWIKGAAATIPVLLVIGAVYIVLEIGNKRSDSAILQYADKSVPIYYVGKRPFSGQFYSEGKARLLTEELMPEMMSKKEFQLVGKPQALDFMIQQQQLNCVPRSTEKDGRRSLYYCHRQT